jgi:hypothetical protein
VQENKSGKKSTLPPNVHNFQPASGGDFSLHPIKMIFHRLLGKRKMIRDLFVCQAFSAKTCTRVFGVSSFASFAPGIFPEISEISRLIRAVPFIAGPPQ